MCNGAQTVSAGAPAPFQLLLTALLLLALAAVISADGLALLPTTEASGPSLALASAVACCAWRPSTNSPRSASNPALNS